MREQRHPRQHAPGDDEIAPPHFVGKRGRDDRHRQRDHREADHDREYRNDLAERRHRHHVAIADGAERHDRPPHRLRNGAEFVRLHIVLDRIEQRGEQQHRAGQDHEAAEQRAPLGVQRRQQRAQRRRIAHQLEERQHAEQHQRVAVAEHQRDRRRQECQQIDDAERATTHIRAAPAVGVMSRREWPTMLQSRAAYSSAKASTRRDFDRR